MKAVTVIIRDEKGNIIAEWISYLSEEILKASEDIKASIEKIINK